MQQLLKRKQTSEGRAELRQRVPVEHSLAHIANRQGPRALYLGIEKNIFDLCRYAVIEIYSPLIAWSVRRERTTT